MVPEITPAEAKAWRERESKRMTDGTYMPLPDNWRNAHWFVDGTARRIRYPDGLLAYPPKYPDHFAHISVDRVSMIAFTENDQKGVRDRQTRINPGKYLAKYFGDVLSKTDIQYFATEMGAQYNDDADLLFAVTADEIEDVYRNGPSSCMDGNHSFSSHVHPVRVYAGFDLQLAYLKRQERITARALCWPEKKIYGRVYGDSARLGAALGKAGYEEGSLSGARITKLMQNGAYVIPFLDYLEGAVDCGEHLQVFERRPSGKKFCCTGGQQNGLSEDDDTQSQSCEVCGDGGNEDDMYWVDGNEAWYCSHCYGRFYTECDHTGETVRRDEVEEVRRSRRADGSWRTAQWGENARENYAFYCEIDSVYYADENEQHEVNGETWGPDAWERYDIVIDGVDTDKRTLPVEALPPVPEARYAEVQANQTVLPLHQEIVVGCMVECIANSGCGGFLPGELYKVKSWHPTAYLESRGTLMIECDSHGRTTNGWGIENFRFHSMPEAVVQTGLHIRIEPNTEWPFKIYNNDILVDSWSTEGFASRDLARRLQQRQPEEVAI